MKSDNDKTKEQLISELEETRRRVTALETIITGDKQATKTPIESMVSFQIIFDTAEIVMAILTPEGKILHSNQALQNMLGFSNEELRNMSYKDVTHPDEVEEEAAQVEELNSGKRKTVYKEKRLVTKDERIVWVWLTATMVKDNDGKPLFGLTIGRDITEFKQAEEELITQIEMLSEVEEIAHLGSWQVDLTTDESILSPQYRQIFGIEAEESGTQSFTERFLNSVHPGDRKRISQLLEESFANQREYISTEYSIMRPDGEVRQISAAVRVKYDDNGQPISSKGFSQDVTEHKRMEEMLQESEGKYRALAESTADAIFMHGRDGRYLYVNQACAEFIGQPPDRIVGSALADFFPVEDARDMVKYIESVFQGESAIRFEHDIALAGGVRHFSGTLSPIYDRKGNIVSVVGVSRDISERKQAEDALRQNEEDLRSLIDSIDDLVFVLNIEGTFQTYIQPSHVTELYAPPGEFVGKHFRDVLPLEVAEQIQAAIEAIQTSGKTQQFDYTLEVSGSTQWFNAIFSPIKILQEIQLELQR